MSVYNVQCPQCGFIGWSNEQFCRNCGCNWLFPVPGYQNNFAEKPDNGSSSRAWMWALFLGLCVVTALFAFWTTQQDSSRQKSSIASTPNGDPPKLKKPLNDDGAQVDFKQYMVAGKTNIVYFYADWWPSCRRWGPIMDRISAQRSDTVVMYVNIKEWGSPVATQYDINSIPHFKVYNNEGRLQVAGARDGGQWILDNYPEMFRWTTQPK